MKNILKRVLQRRLGFERYLYIFARYVIATLRWNRREKDFLYFVTLLPDGGSILDIGANIGAMTTHLAKRRRNARIYAIEPVPCNIDTLKRIVGHYKLNNVRIIETALGNKNGDVEMVLPRENNIRLHGLSHVLHKSIDSYNEGDRMVRPLSALDTMEEFKNGNKITGIKLDVENYEYFVLDGARELITKHHPVIYSELWENENRTRCFELLKGMGYSVNVLDHKKLVEFNSGIHKKQNFFFIPGN